MTLTVVAMRCDETGAWSAADTPSDLAGFENTRRTFYGSTWVLGLGLVLLPRLKNESELWVEGEQLVQLAEEVTILQGAIKGRRDERYWAERLANIAEAIAVASADGTIGAVLIS